MTGCLFTDVTSCAFPRRLLQGFGAGSAKVREGGVSARRVEQKLEGLEPLLTR